MTLQGPPGQNTRAPSRLTTHDGIGLAYDNAGIAGGEPVVFLHGATDTRLTWARVAPAVQESHRLLMLDTRGHGDSDRAPDGYDLVDSHVADVKALCDSELDRSAVLVGHSHGGVTAAATAARHPGLVRAVVLLDPPLWGRFPAELTDYLEALEGVLAATASADDPHDVMVSMLAQAPAFSGNGSMAEVLGPDGVDRQAFAWSHVDPAFLATIREAASEEEPIDFDEPITCPVHVIRADPDAWMPCFRADHVDRLRRLATHSTFVIAPSAGHTLHLEQPEWIADQLVEFLARL